MPQVKIAAKWGRDAQPFNGLMEDDHVADLIKDPESRRYALVSYDVLRIIDEVKDGHRQVPALELMQIEPVTGETAERIKADMRKLFKQRTGRDDEPQRLEERNAAMFDVDGEGQHNIPEPSGDELMAERAEGKPAADLGEG